MFDVTRTRFLDENKFLYGSHVRVEALINLSKEAYDLTILKLA